MFKKLRKSEKGFTLAELLIVVAIIGVLVAISIPIFTSQIEKANQAADAANIRAAYAECAADALTDTTSNASVAVSTDATMKSSKWDKMGSDFTIANVKPSSIKKTKGSKVKVSVNKSTGEVTFS